MDYDVEAVIAAARRRSLDAKSFGDKPKMYGVLLERTEGKQAIAVQDLQVTIAILFNALLAY